MSMANSFVDARPDGFAMSDKKQIISLLEFTRAMDFDDNWETPKDYEKRARYTAALAFFDQLSNKGGWSPLPFHPSSHFQGAAHPLPHSALPSRHPEHGVGDSASLILVFIGTQ